MILSLSRLLALLLALGLAVEASAQPAPSGPGAAVLGEAPKVDPAALDHLIRTLQDPASRDGFLADLKALQAAAQQAQPPARAPLPTALGAVFLQAMSDAFGRLRAGVEALRASLAEPTHLWAWLTAEVEDPARRALLLDFLWQIGLILGGGILADLLVGRLVRRGQERLKPEAGPRPFARLCLQFAHCALALLPVLAFAAAAYGMVALVEPGPPARLAVIAIVSAVVIARGALMFCRFLLSPFAPTLRLLPIGDETAAYLYVWAVRLVSLAVYGYFVLQVALLLGFPLAAYALALRLLGLAAVLLAAAVILQSREPVARVIEHGGERRQGGLRSVKRLRRQLARSWHVLALLYLLAIYVTWAADLPGGFAYLGRGTGLTVLILALAWLALTVLNRGLDRFLAINRDLISRHPLLELRANRYLPLLRRGLVLAIRLAAALAILNAWGIEASALWASAAAREVLGRLATILIMLGAALLIWEVVDASISFYLERRDHEGRPLLASSRARTLLPLVRNALLIVIGILAGLTILSELGVNIAPLLAGAGVVGLAIGFGAQTLVKDVITGAFILFEDTLNIGDVVAVNGISGQVEGMSIRTLKLRDGSGTLHTIPFGTVAMVSNMTRDFGYWALDVGVGYGENPDEVMAALRAVYDDLARDPRFARDALGLEMQGVDRFTDNAVRISARIKTRALRQWDVGREFNRRMKLKFDELGIQLAPPSRVVYVAAPGAAPAVPPGGSGAAA